nr:MAG TPA: Photosystem II protein D1 [Caudoviricetes sp.]
MSSFCFIILNFFSIILEIFSSKLLTCTVHMVIYKHKQQNKHSHRRCECLRDNRRKMICQNF